MISFRKRAKQDDGNKRVYLEATDYVLLISGGQSPINPRQTFRQRKHVIDDRITDFAVEIAQLAFGFSIDGDAERRDALVLSLAQSFTRVFASVAGVAIIVIVWATVREHNQQPSAGILLSEPRGGMTNRRAQPGVVLVSNAADALLHFVGIHLVKIFDDVELYVAPAFRGKAVDRINIADGFECLAQQHEALLFDLDNAAPRTRIWL